MKKNILITGVTGMVGSHLADFLIDNTDHNIYGMCRWRSPTNNVSHLFNFANEGKRIKFIYGDLNDSALLIELIKEIKPNLIFHLAAQSFPLASFHMANITFETNINGTYNLLNAVKYLKLDPFVHICSSSEIFGKVDKKNLPIKENERFHPASPYAISKVGTDLIAKFFFEAYKIKTITTRMFTHTGPRRGDVFSESSFAKQIALIEAKKIKPIIKVGNLNSLRTYADVRDAVRAYYMLLTKNPIPGEIYNIGGEYTCTVKEMLNFLVSQSIVKNIKIKVDNERIRPIDADLQVPDTKKFKTHTGWKPRYSFKDTMLDLLNYWRDRVKHEDFLVR